MRGLPVSVGSALLLSLCCGLYGTSALASTPTPTAPGAPATAQVSTPDCTPIPLVASTVGAMGEQIDRYADGATQVIPPANLDYSTATDAQLAELGLPAAPVDPTEHAIWAARMHSAVHVPAGGLCAHPNLPRANIYPRNVAEAPYSGLFVTNDPGHPYTGISAENRVFPAQSGDCASPKGETSWTGLFSGGGSPALLQAGTYRNTSLNGDQPEIFWEKISQGGGGTSTGANTIGPGTFPISSGDLVFYEVDYSNSGGTQTATFQWADESRNPVTYDSLAEPLASDGEVWWDGSTAAYIDEKLAGYNYQKNPSIGWTDAYIYGNGGGNYPGNLPDNTVYIPNDSSMGYGLVSVSNWNDYWLGCS